MAGRFGGGESRLGHGGSIFPDDDRDRRARDSGGRGAERGFLERAGDEVRSWFGDEEAERRRERDIGRSGRGSASDETGWRSRTPYGGFGFGAPGAYPEIDRDAGSRTGFGGRWDDNYRRWRDRQIEQFDRDYEDYCRERQQRFDRDFDSWRTSRLTEGESASGTRGSPGGSVAAEPAGTDAADGKRGRGGRPRG